MSRKPAKFEDSFTTERAEFSVRVARPFPCKTSERCKETVLVKIDCAGEIEADADTIDVLISMLEMAKVNLLARR